jgi:hypothetical protein
MIVLICMFTGIRDIAALLWRGLNPFGLIRHPG